MAKAPCEWCATMIVKRLEQLGGLEVDTETGRSVTEADVQRVEQHIGFSLPDDYRAFLMVYGSGMAHFNESVAFAHAAHLDGAVSINAFFGAVPLESFGSYDLVANYDQTRGDLPANMLPIAHDGGGNYICLSVSGGDKGSLYYWNHEEVMETEGEPTYKHIQFVAFSFGELVNKLQVHTWE